MVGNFSLISGVDKQIELMRDMLRAEIASSKSELTTLIEKNHSETLLKFAEIEHRLARLESEHRVIQ